MKLIVKTLAGKQLPVEIEDSNTIRELKEAIEKAHDMKADSLKLIAYGKVLDKDDNKCSDHSLKENDYIVAMVQKAKVVKPKKEEVKKEEPVAAASTQPAADAQPVAEAVTQPVAAQPQPAAATQPETLSPEVEASVTELMAISGKPRDLCIQALRAAQNIPDVAFEFLMSGHIPQVSAGGEEAYGDDDGMGEDDDGMGGLGQYNLDAGTLQSIQALVNNPSFPMIRQRMVQDPQFSAQFMQQLQQTQPQIFNAIQQNPGILMSLILGHDPMAGMGGGMGGGGQQQPPPGSIQVSPEEMEAIENLVTLGFPKNRAAEAYFACDKNEEMAANFLFESGNGDEDQAMAAAMLASQQQQPPVDVPNAQPEANANAEPQPDAGANANADQPAAEDNNKDEKKDGPEGDADMGGDAGGGSSLA